MNSNASFLQESKPKAIKEAKKFLDLLKDADPGIAETKHRRAFRILFYYQHKMEKRIEKIKRRLWELELRLSNLFRTRDN